MRLKQAPSFCLQKWGPNWYPIGPITSHRNQIRIPVEATSSWELVPTLQPPPPPTKLCHFRCTFAPALPSPWCVSPPVGASWRLTLVPQGASSSSLGSPCPLAPHLQGQGGSTQPRGLRPRGKRCAGQGRELVGCAGRGRELVSCTGRGRGIVARDEVAMSLSTRDKGARLPPAQDMGVRPPPAQDEGARLPPARDEGARLPPAWDKCARGTRALGRPPRGTRAHAQDRGLRGTRA